MSVLSVICLAGLRKAEFYCDSCGAVPYDQEGSDPEGENAHVRSADLKTQQMGSIDREE